MRAGKGGAGWDGSGSGSVQGGPCPAEPLSWENPTLCPAVPVPPSPPQQSGSPPAAFGAAPNPFLPESSSLAATSSSRCAAYGSRPALAQTSLGTVLKHTEPGRGAPSLPLLPFPAGLHWARGCACWGPGAVQWEQGARCAGAVNAGAPMVGARGEPWLCLPGGPAAAERHSRCRHLCFEPCLCSVHSLARLQ